MEFRKDLLDKIKNSVTSETIKKAIIANAELAAEHGADECLTTIRWDGKEDSSTDEELVPVIKIGVITGG